MFFFVFLIFLVFFCNLFLTPLYFCIFCSLHLMRAGELSNMRHGPEFGHTQPHHHEKRQKFSQKLKKM